MKILVAVDMQKDFIDGALGTKEAAEIVPRVRAKIERYERAGDVVIFTRDTHTEDYLETQEGKRLPVPHCIRETPGWEISDQLSTAGHALIDKDSFGSLQLAGYISGLDNRIKPGQSKESGVIEQIELVGLCTDICVISNAVILKSRLPEIRILVDGACCAGVTPDSHKTALEAMKMCQIDVENMYE